MNVKQYFIDGYTVFDDDVVERVKVLFPNYDVDVLTKILNTQFYDRCCYRELGYVGETCIHNFIKAKLDTNMLYLTSIFESLNITFDPLVLNKTTTKTDYKDDIENNNNLSTTDSNVKNIDLTNTDVENNTHKTDGTNNTTDVGSSTVDDVVSTSENTYDSNDLKVVGKVDKNTNNAVNNTTENTLSSTVNDKIEKTNRNTGSENNEFTSKKSGVSTENRTGNNTTDTSGFSNINYVDALSSLYKTKYVNLVDVIIGLADEEILTSIYDFSNIYDEYLFA